MIEIQLLCRFVCEVWVVSYRAVPCRVLFCFVIQFLLFLVSRRRPLCPFQFRWHACTSTMTIFSNNKAPSIFSEWYYKYFPCMNFLGFDSILRMCMLLSWWWCLCAYVVVSLLCHKKIRSFIYVLNACTSTLQ